MKNLCKRCPEKPKCTKLCEEAEEYVNEDKIKKSPYLRGEAYLKEPTDLNFISNLAILSYQDMINSDFPLGKEELTILKQVNLTKKQFKCIYLYYWKRKKQHEIADELGISQKVISIHIKRGKKKLLKLLKLLKNDD